MQVAKEDKWQNTYGSAICGGGWRGFGAKKATLMQILFTGQNGSGAWAMRGVQIAATRPGWRAIADATDADMAGVDAVVIVKRCAPETLAAARRRGVPIIYDPLDFWQQKGYMGWMPHAVSRVRDAAAARALVAAQIAQVAPDLLLCPTRAMAEDLAPLGWPVAVHHHHFDSRLTAAKSGLGSGRPTVMFHGRASFLKEWHPIAQIACRLAGARFVVHNGHPPPPCDAMLAVRGGFYGNWLARRWKSNVKAATAARLGVPLIAWPEDAYIETAPDAFWFTTPRSLAQAVVQALEAPRPTPELERFSVAWSADQLAALIAPLVAAQRIGAPQRVA